MPGWSAASQAWSGAVPSGAVDHRGVPQDAWIIDVKIADGLFGWASLLAGLRRQEPPVSAWAVVFRSAPPLSQSLSSCCQVVLNDARSQSQPSLLLRCPIWCSVHGKSMNRNGEAGRVFPLGA